VLKAATRILYISRRRFNLPSRRFADGVSGVGATLLTPDLELGDRKYSSDEEQWHAHAQKV